MGTAGATNEVAALKEAVSVAEHNAAAERAEREKQEARVAVVRQELQALMEKHESLERDSKTRESELASALESAKTAKAEAHKALQEVEDVKKIAADILARIGAKRDAVPPTSFWRGCLSHPWYGKGTPVTIIRTRPKCPKPNTMT